jgi:hypothetical protein
MRVVSYAADGARFRAGVMSGEDKILDVGAALRQAGLPEAESARARDARGFFSLGPRAATAT